MSAVIVFEQEARREAKLKMSIKKEGREGREGEGGGGGRRRERGGGD